MPPSAYSPHERRTGRGGLTVRIGQGVDIHRFSEDPHRPLVLGGVVIEGARGLGGHSDADAVAHTLADAVLGRRGPGRSREALPRYRPGLGGGRQPCVAR